MHTYIKEHSIVGKNGNQEKEWFEVGYYTVYSSANPHTDAESIDTSWNCLAKFEHEIQAATYTNFLNGGSRDVNLMADLLKKQV